MPDPLESLMHSQLAQARERLVHGLVTARVRRIEDDGSCQLDYLSMGSDEPSAPARVMMPMAGAGRGTYFFPEPGDEVVVAFELGNTNLPIILGAVWNNESRPPSQARPSADNNVRTIVSRSGHELTFDDTPGAEKVTLRSQSGHELTLDDAPGRGRITLSTAGGKRLVLDDTPPGSISLEAGAVTIRLDAAGPLQLQAAGPVSVQGTAIALQGMAVTIGGALAVNGTPYHLHVHLGVPHPTSTTGPVVVP